MEGFYISLVFIGIILIIVSLAMVIYDKKKFHDYRKELDEKKQDLLSIIKDAEQMVEEMNKFSDYIVTQIVIKNEEVYKALNVVDERLKNFYQKIDIEQSGISELKSEHFPEVVYNEEQHFSNERISVMPVNKIQEVYFKDQKQLIKTEEKTDVISRRHKEVIRLAASGFSDTEIAKNLKMGKGEVQLILGVNK